MTSKLIGFRRFHYKRKSDGQMVDACNLYITYPGDSTVVGEVAETVFCNRILFRRILKWVIICRFFTTALALLNRFLTNSDVVHG